MTYRIEPASQLTLMASAAGNPLSLAPLGIQATLFFPHRGGVGGHQEEAAQLRPCILALSALQFPMKLFPLLAVSQTVLDHLQSQGAHYLLRQALSSRWTYLPVNISWPPWLSPAVSSSALWTAWREHGAGCLPVPAPQAFAGTARVAFSSLSSGWALPGFHSWSRASEIPLRPGRGEAASSHVVASCKALLVLLRRGSTASGLAVGTLPVPLGNFWFRCGTLLAAPFPASLQSLWRSGWVD